MVNFGQLRSGRKNHINQAFFHSFIEIDMPRIYPLQLDLSILYKVPGLSFFQQPVPFSFMRQIREHNGAQESRVDGLLAAAKECGAEILSEFGNRKPTDAEISQILDEAKSRPAPLTKFKNRIPTDEEIAQVLEDTKYRLQTLTKFGHRTRTGMELFHAFIATKDYYPSKADEKIQDDNLEYFSELTDGAVLVELCAGHSHKVVRLLKKLPKEKWPKHIIINDIFPDNIRASIANLRTIGYPSKNITGTPGDIRDDDVWKVIENRLYDKIYRKIKKKGNHHITCEVKKLDITDQTQKLMGLRVAAQMDGATFNDFASPDMLRLLERLSSLPPKSVLAIGIDSSTHFTTLHNAYNNPILLNLALLGAENALHNNSWFDVKRVKPSMRIEKTGVFTDVTFSVLSDGLDIFCSYNPIKKIPEPYLKQMFHNARVEVAEQMRFVDPEGFPNANYSKYIIKPVHRSLLI